MLIEKDFAEDIRVGLTAELEELGYAVPPSTEPPIIATHTVCVQHWNAYARRIPGRPRTVHRSRELQARAQLLSAPIQRGLAVVESELETGVDLTARLSRQLRRIRFNDLMLNDWGLQHLHLDDINRANGTSEVLILLVRADDAYLIDVRHHGHWADQDLVEIVHTNWPAAIAGYRQPHALRLAHRLTDDERRTLRQKSGNAPIQTSDGTVYMAIGGGIVGTGANIRAVMWGDWLLRQTQAVSDYLDEHGQWLEALIANAVNAHPERMRVHLVNVNRERAILEFEHSGTNYRFVLPIVDPPQTLIDLSGEAPKPDDA